MSEKSLILLDDIATFFSTAGYAPTVAGTFYYFAPEMVNGRPHNHKIDIWALGVTLYQLLTLKLPVGLLNCNYLKCFL